MNRDGPDGGRPEGGADRLWTVAEFAARTGVPATTLRYWDDAGLVPARRLPNGHRRYGPTDAARVGMVRMCQQLGSTSEEIRLVLDAPDAGERARYARERLPEVRERVAVLETAVAVLEHVAVCDHADAAACGLWMSGLLARLGSPTLSA